MAIRYLDALPHELSYEPTPKRVRTELAGTTIAESDGVLIVYESGRAVPFYAFPEADVRSDALTPSERPISDAHGGSAEFWTVTVGDDVAENAIWRYADADLRRYLAFNWEQFDRWFEEDEEVIGHPRSPFHRTDVRAGSRHVRVELEGELLAESRRPSLLFETGLPTRYYLPREDVRMELLEPTDTATICAYKGRASYWSVRAGDHVERDLAWTYPDPLPDNRQIRDLVCFLNEKADVTVDGEPVGRPETQWSPGVRSAPRGGGSGARQGPHETSDR